MVSDVNLHPYTEDPYRLKRAGGFKRREWAMPEYVGDDPSVRVVPTSSSG